jgi:methane/ammonia monooxygenase subunit B
LTISGNATILDSWPETLGEPKVGYVNVEAPGPVMLMKDRTVNGMSAPDAIFISKGQTYAFSMTLVGREAGVWHIHPTFAIQGAGTLIGPGQWITVESGGGGTFNNSLQLLNGQTINLETYNLAQLTLWHWLGFLVALVWILYWIIPRPTVTRLAVTSQIPLNSDGHEIGLITRRDQRVAVWFAIGTVLLLGAGWVYQQMYFPVKIPLQVIRLTPPAGQTPPRFAEVQVQRADYDPARSTLSMDVRATNSGSAAMTLASFTTSTLTFVNPAVAPAEHMLVADLPATLQPNESRLLRLTMQDVVWTEERLIEVDKPRIDIAGLLVFKNTEDVEDRVAVRSSVTPKLFP